MKKTVLLIFISIITIKAYTQDDAPDFNVTDIYGHKHRLFSDYLNNNKYVFIDFFSVGCQSCQELAPSLDTVYRDFGCNYGDVIFLGIDGYAYDKDVFNFVGSYSMTFPAVSGNEGGGNKVFTDYGVTATPKKILISPQGKIIADYPFEYSAEYYRDTLLAQNLTLRQCSGNNFLFYSVVSQNDSVVGTIDAENKTVNIIMPAGTDLSNLKATFIAETNAEVSINGTEQISGETTNDYSSGILVYQITSEDGSTAEWTVNASLSSKSLAEKNIKIYPNPASSEIFIEYGNIPPENRKIYLFDTGGKIINANPAKKSANKINIEHLSKGIYFLKIEAPNFVIFKKIIKQ